MQFVLQIFHQLIVLMRSCRKGQLKATVMASLWRASGVMGLLTTWPEHSVIVSMCVSR